MDSHADRYRFPVRLAGSVASRILSNVTVGRVAALFESSFYVETEAGLVCIGNGTLEPGPLNLVTTAPAATNWSAGGLRPGAKASIAKTAIHVGDRACFPLNRAAEWSPDPVPGSWQANDLTRGIHAFRELSAGHVPAEGLGRFLGSGFRPDRHHAVGRMAERPIAGLRQWLAAAFHERDARAMRGLKGVHPLIGLGPGLTPSGDDFVGGMMIALHGMGESEICRQLWGPVRRLAEEAGNPISRAHLEAASEGKGSVGVHRALAAILSGRSHAIRASLPGIDRVGHTSGWDAMAGVIVALESRPEICASHRQSDRGRD